MVALLLLCLILIFGGGWLIHSLGVRYDEPVIPTPQPVAATPWPTSVPEPMFQPLPSSNKAQWVVMGFCVPYEYLSYTGCEEFCSTPYGECDIFQGPIKNITGNAR